MSDHFERKCNEAGCYYELRGGFYLREDDILAAEFGGAGIAGENYNYRHVGLALNAVGSGVVDCSAQGESCYSNAFIEYDLEHSAFSSRVTDYGGGSQCFSFGRGAIRRGKMLTAERVVGVPLSSADEGLISGEEFMKPVFRGRPLDGAYALRIHEEPGFNIEALDDVQIVLQHNYWSRVQRTLD